MEPDRTKTFGRITFAAVVVFVLGILAGAIFDSPGIFWIFFGLAILVFASNLLLMREGYW